MRLFNFFEIAPDFWYCFNIVFNNKINKISVFYIFNKWNSLQEIQHLPKNRIIQPLILLVD